MLRIAICDDDSYICSEIENILLDYEKSSAVNIEINIFYMGESLIDFIIKGHTFDLIFLDIELGTTTGIEIGSRIRNEFDDYTSRIVFITSKNGYEQELFNIQPLNFIKKPIDQGKLKNCVSLAIKLLDIDNRTFEYKRGRDVIKVNIKDIIYFESRRKQIRIVTHTGEDYFYETLVNIKKRLPKTFVEPHGSFLVHFDKILRFTRASVFMINGEEVPVSQRNLKHIRSMLIHSEREKMNANL